MSSTIGGGIRSGPFIAAVWLIGIGLVFLLQQLLDLSWIEAWPLFVILAGVGTLAGTFVSPRRPGPFMAALAWPFLLIAVGVLLLLSTTEVLGVGPGELLAGWWPLLIIAAGAWLVLASLLPSGGSTSGWLEFPLPDADRASVRVRFGGGELSIGLAAPGHLADGNFTGGGGVRHRIGPDGRLDLEPEGWSGWPFLEKGPRWELGVTGELPLDLDVGGGAARSVLDLTETRVASLRLQTGASDTRVRLPRAAGETRVKADAGAATLTFEVPAGVAVRIASQMALGKTSIDPAIPRAGSGWESADYATAENRVELRISGGVGQVRVKVVG